MRAFSPARRYGSGSPHRPTRVYRYMLHSPFEPKVVVDVGAVWQVRRELLRVYKSQVSLGADDEPTALNDGRFVTMLRDAPRSTELWPACRTPSVRR